MQHLPKHLLVLERSGVWVCVRACVRARSPAASKVLPDNETRVLNALSMPSDLLHHLNSTFSLLLSTASEHMQAT